MSPSRPLQSFRDLDRTSPQFHRQLSALLGGNEYRGVISSLEGEDLAWLVEYLDNVIAGISDPSSLESKEFLHELGRICSLKNVLPKPCLLSNSLPDVSLLSAPEGTFDASRLRTKRVRIHPNEDQPKAKQTFHRLTVVWKHLNHQKIVPLLGVTIDPLQCVSVRMPGGHLTEYVANHPDVNRSSLLSDVAEGLNYLHSCNVIHGDLNGSNILVDAAGHARITDFGLAMVTKRPRGISPEDGHGARWIAPEILDDQGTCSKEADIFSFAGVTIEAFTGAVPFSGEPPRAATSAIMLGQRPPRPTHPDLTDGLWRLTQRCWGQEPHLRPCALRLSCGFDIPAWKSLIDHPLTSEERITLIADIFSDRDEAEAVKRLHGDDAQSFVDIIDEMLSTLTPLLRRKCLSTLCKICGRQALLPRSAQIPLCYNRMEAPLYRGGYGDVWEGEYQGCKVAVKVLTVGAAGKLDKITRMFCKEVITWKALRHQNVLPLLGVTMNRNQFVMVSEWMINGNINEFIEERTDANRFELLKDVARGLVYMHEEGMIHGDLKGANILIDQHCHARLADFGLTVIVSDPAYSTTSSSYTTGGTARWMSPELLNPAQFDIKDSRPTKESDCYALGMVILEVLSGQVPFTRGCNTFMVMGKVVGGERPERPQGAEGIWFTDNLWATLQVCWSHQPNDRLTVEAVLQCLEEVSTVWQPPPCVEMNSDESSLAVSSPVLYPGILLPPSPRLSVDSSTPGSLARGFETIAAGSAGTDGLYSPPQLTLLPPSDELDIEESGQTIISAPLEERAYLPTSGPLPVQDLTARVIDNADVEPSVGDTVGVPTTLAIGTRNENTTRDPGIIHQGIQRPGVATPVTSQSISASASLIEVVNWDGISQDIEWVLAAAFEAEDYLDCIKDLQARGFDPESYINSLDKVIDRLATNSDIRKRCIRALCGVCGFYGILPTSYIFTGKLSIPDSLPRESGGFSDVWRVTDEDHKDQVFAIKKLRVSQQESIKEIRKRYCREVILSKRVTHPNILSIEGVLPKPFEFCMVSQWAELGNLLEYVTKYREADRLNLLIGVTRGLDYLHNCGIVHGDIKSSNVLIDMGGNPRIIDFVSSWFTKDIDSVDTSKPAYGYSIRWAAPELLEKIRIPKSMPARSTTKSDVYSLSMVIVELVTGNVPFPESPYPKVLSMVLEGGRPHKPRHFDAPGMTPDVWKIARKCWHKKTEERPDVHAVLESLESLVNPDTKRVQVQGIQRWRQVFNG